MSSSPLLLPELLAEIFQHCCQASTPLIRTNSPPLLLSRVCSLWRATALATPQLWSSFALTSKQWSDQENTLALLHRYLSHSGALPLNIFFEFDASDPYYHSDNDPTPFIDAIARHASRWRTITLKLPQQSMDHFLATLPTIVAPHLTSLTLVETFACLGAPPTEPSQVDWATPVTIDDICRFPSLQKLSLSWLPNTPPSLFALFPTQQIQELKVIPHYSHANQFSALDCAILLSMFSGLHKLSISLADLHSMHPTQVAAPHQSTTLPSLTHLSLSGHPTAIANFWDIFHQLPKLKQVLSRYPANDPNEESFVSLLQRSGRKVKPEDEDDEYFGFGDISGAIEIVGRDDKC